MRVFVFPLFIFLCANFFPSFLISKMSFLLLFHLKMRIEMAVRVLAQQSVMR